MRLYILLPVLNWEMVLISVFFRPYFKNVQNLILDERLSYVYCH